MTLEDVINLHDEILEMYERGQREYVEWEAGRQERRADRQEEYRPSESPGENIREAADPKNEQQGPPKTI
jgi:hypothetical protein